MRETKIVLSKELKRIFTDKKMIFSLFILPVLLIVGMFALMNFMMDQENAETEKHVPVVYAANMPDSFKKFVEASENSVIAANASEIDSIKNMLKEAKADVLLVFSENFDANIQAGKLPDIDIYYNPSENNSVAAYGVFSAGVEGYRQMLQSGKFGSVEAIMMFTINATSDNPEDFEVYDNQKATGKMLGQMLPYFITLLLFAGAMSLGIDTIAGEKERGTLSSLLITPVKRTKIVLGKLISLMVVSVLSALVYVISLVVAMPMMNIGNELSNMIGDISSALSPIQIVQLVVIMIAIVFLYVSVIGLVSVYAKDTKEASTYVMPAYILVIGVGMVTMFGEATSGVVPYAIPFYNCSITLKSLLSGDLTGIQFAVSAISTFIAGGLITLFIGKLFNSEKIMFNS